MAVCLVTGCDKGIGRVIAINLHKRGEHVIATCLNDSDELRALGLQVESNIDVTQDAPLRSLAKRLTSAETRIDVLINNAGVLKGQKLGEIDYDEMRRHFEINALGPLRVTEALLDCLNEGAKVGIVTSRVGSLGENISGGNYAYRVSKCAVNMIGVNLNHDLRKRGMMVILLHPGMVRSDMGGKGLPGSAIEPEEAAAGLIKLVDEAQPGDLPEFKHVNGELLPW